MRVLISILFYLHANAFAQTWKVAVSRYLIEGNQDVKSILKKTENEVAYASKKKAEFILFPELNTLDLFDLNPKDSDVPKNIEKTIQQSKSIEQQLKKLAQKYKINILGHSQFVREGKKTVNRAYVYFKDGKVQYQDKMYPTPWERKYNISGTKNLTLFEYEKIKFAVLICHDIEFPNVSNQLVKHQPQVIFVPSQTDSIEGRNRVIFTAQARAIEHMSYVILTGNTGKKDAVWHSYQGGAHLFHPQNKYFPNGLNQSVLDSGQPIIFVLDLGKLQKSRKDKSQVFPARDIELF